MRTSRLISRCTQAAQRRRTDATPRGSNEPSGACEVAHYQVKAQPRMLLHELGDLYPQVRIGTFTSADAWFARIVERTLTRNLRRHKRKTVYHEVTGRRYTTWRTLQRALCGNSKDNMDKQLIAEMLVCEWKRLLEQMKTLSLDGVQRCRGCARKHWSCQSYPRGKHVNGHETTDHTLDGTDARTSDVTNRMGTDARPIRGWMSQAEKEWSTPSRRQGERRKPFKLVNLPFPAPAGGPEASAASCSSSSGEHGIQTASSS